jgi:hypothetical protein
MGRLWLTAFYYRLDNLPGYGLKLNLGQFEEVPFSIAN